ncbi:MAG TPA: exo-alpha-sialidase [Pseudonocardiaceae bacterium]
MSNRTLLAVGTKKGLWLAISDDDRRTWSLTAPQYPMTGVYAVAIDTRRPVPRLLAGVTSEHFGPSVAVSDDLGATWLEPDTQPLAFPEDTGTALGRVWQLTPGPDDQPDVVYAGSEPSALFRSDDGGRTFEFVRGLWDHEHRPRWEAGFGGQAVHTVLPHPTEHERVTVAMSTGGVYQTEDGGGTWRPSNRGISARFLPDPLPEFGQCVHKVAASAGNPDRMYLQNHGGVYRSTNNGASWESIADGLPGDFGFAMAAHPHRPDVIYNFPLVADEHRFAPGGRCRVYRSEDAGSTWTALFDGLPDDGFWSIVLRDALCTDNGDPTGIYFGTRSGEVYASRDEGDGWQQVADHLPDVLCVRAAVL